MITAPFTSNFRQLALGIAAIACLAIAFTPRTAAAACGDEEEAASNGDAGRKNYRTVRNADGTKTFVIEKAFVVCGKVPKPTVIYVLQAAAVNYEWELLKQNFLPKVLASLKKAPF